MLRYIVHFLPIIFLLVTGSQHGFAANINNFGQIPNSRSATAQPYGIEDVNERYDNNLSLNFEHLGDNDFLNINEQMLLESQSNEWAKFRREEKDKYVKLEIAVSSSFGGFSNTPNRANFEASEYKPNTRKSHSGQSSSFNISESAKPFYFELIYFIKNAPKEYQLTMYSLIFLAVIFMFVKAVLLASPVHRRNRRLSRSTRRQTKTATTPPVHRKNRHPTWSTRPQTKAATTPPVHRRKRHRSRNNPVTN